MGSEDIPVDVTSPEEWDEEDVQEWLRSRGFANEVESFKAQVRLSRLATSRCVPRPRVLMFLVTMIHLAVMRSRITHAAMS